MKALVTSTAQDGGLVAARSLASAGFLVTGTDLQRVPRGVLITSSYRGWQYERRRLCALTCQRYGTDVTPVVAFVQVARAAIAEKSRRIGVSAKAEVLDPIDAGGCQACGDVSGQVEQGVAGP